MTYIDPRSKILQHVDRLAEIKAGGRPAPVNVEIDLSNRCSLGCEWCHFGYTHTRGPLADKRPKPAGAHWGDGGDLMPQWLATKILAELATVGVRSVTWTGGGEPTIHPQFDLITAGCPASIEQSIYTNGYHLFEERAAQMRERMTWIYISLDSASREDYKKVKLVDAFDKVCAGTRVLASMPGNATLGVGFLLTRDNWQETEAMYHLGLDLGADYVNFRPTVQYDQKQPNKPAEDTAWMTPLIDHLEHIKDVDGVEVDLERFRMYQNWNGRPYTACHWVQMQTVITPNGKMWLCCNTREHPAAFLGDLHTESFLTVWQRVRPVTDFSDCRVMCRGHIANITLDNIMGTVAHHNFI